MVNASLGWLYNVSCLILSVPTTNQRSSTYILTTMNVKLLAASALIVQSVVLMVLPTFFRLSNVKPTQVCSAQGHLKGNYELNSAFEMADRLLEPRA